MIVAGIDIGSLSAKSVILNEHNLFSWEVIPTIPDSVESAYNVMEKTLEKEKLTLKDLDCVVATGYGRVNVPFANATRTEISCHARGTQWFFPNVRTILDMGGQDCKVIKCDQNGRIKDFVMNDKCAAGTGRYLERIAKILSVSLPDIGNKSFQIVEQPAVIRSFCAVFAENDVILLARKGVHINDILAGACEAITRRIFNLIDKIGFEEPFSISGGIAKNIGIVRRLERDLRTLANVSFEPQIIGALGAACFAKDRIEQVER